MSVVFLQGNSRDVLKQLPPGFFHCCVTSPPYFGLRKYDGGEEDWSDGWRGQLGGEPTPELYVQHLVEICQGVRRVLRPDGVFWLNIGDSWAGSGKSQMGDGSHAAKCGEKQHTNTGCLVGGLPKGFCGNGCKPLDMILVPSLLALALRADGWYVRSQIIWSKQNPMPESVNGWRWEKHRVKGGDDWVDCSGCERCDQNDGYVLRRGSWRPTDSFEVIWMLTKTNKYFCDREAVMEPGVYPAGEKRNGGNHHKCSDVGSRTTEGLHNKEWNGTGGRNLRSVWDFPTQPFPGAHFAVFPPRLPELCIKSSTSDGGCCPKCGAPYARIIEKAEVPHDGETECKNVDDQRNTRRSALMRQVARERGQEYANSTSTIGWKPTCSCGRGEPVPCRVIDPFSGSGTTAIVADILGRIGFGIDISEKYVEIAKERFSSDREKIVKSLSRNNWKGY